MDFEAEMVQCNFEFSACYLIGIMLPTGRKGRPIRAALRRIRGTQKDLWQLRQASRMDHYRLGAIIAAPH
jgi:hypothetical protein